MGFFSDIGNIAKSGGLAPFFGKDIVADFFGADAAEQAAKTQTKYLEKAAATQRQAAAMAEADILNLMVPALADYTQNIQNSQQYLAQGTTDIMKILQQSVGNADQVLSSAGMDAQKAIMGSAAMAKGIPMSQFDQTYTQMQDAPPLVRSEALANMRRDLGTTPSAGPDIGSSLFPGYSTVTPISQGSVGSIGTAGVSRPVLMSEIAAKYPGAVPGVAATSTSVPAASNYTIQSAGAPPQSVGTPSTTTPIGGSGTGFLGAAENIQSGYGTAQNALTSAYGAARGDVTGAAQSALARLAATKAEGLGAYEPYSTAGKAAAEREAALAGAYGPEAQKSAIDAYIESPGQAYLRQQEEKALLRNQAAIGGLGGANVRTALQQQAMNIASTQQQQYLENLRSIAGRGLEVAGAESNLATTTGLYGAQLTAGAGQTLAQLAQQYGISSAQLAQMSSSELAQLAQQTGINLSNLQSATGAARAALQTELGGSLANVKAGSLTDITNLGIQGATTNLGVNQNVSSMLANLATGTGTNVANLQAQQGSALATGQYLAGQALPQALATLGGIAATGLGAYAGVGGFGNLMASQTTPQTTTIPR